jgi:uncharacterized protein with NAD-binding domain and iron-sulfur cluster
MMTDQSQGSSSQSHYDKLWEEQNHQYKENLEKVIPPEEIARRIHAEAEGIYKRMCSVIGDYGRVMDKQVKFWRDVAKKVAQQLDTKNYSNYMTDAANSIARVIQERDKIRFAYDASVAETFDVKEQFSTLHAKYTQVCIERDELKRLNAELIKNGGDMLTQCAQYKDERDAAIKVRDEALSTAHKMSECLLGIRKALDPEMYDE